VNGQERWILSYAYNLAAQFATGDLLLKVDCDTKVHRDFLKAHPMEKRDNLFYRYSWLRGQEENQQHLSGVFFVPKKYFEDVRGYDERIQNYGWDDSDLYRRIEKLEVNPLPVNVDYLQHIKHEDSVRSADQEDLQSPMYHTQLNSVLSEKVLSWSLAWMNRHSEFHCVLRSGDGSYVEAVMMREVKRLEDSISEKELRVAEKTAYNRVLHDAYGLPWGILSEAEDSLSDILTALQQYEPSTDWKKRGAIFGEVYGSPAQRLLALTSMVALAKKYDRILFLTWKTDDRTIKRKHDSPVRLSAMFDWRKSGFVENMEASETPKTVFFPLYRLKCHSNIEICADSDSAWNSVASGTNETEVEMTLKQMLPDKHHVVLHLDKTMKGLTQKELYDAFQSLVPSNTIMERISKFGDTRDKIGVYIGMHMRSKQITDFIKRLQKLSAANGDAEFFIVGSEVPEVIDLRRGLDMPTWEDDVQYETETEYERLVREVSELYALGRSRTIVRDGRCPEEVQEFMSILNSQKKSEGTLVVDSNAVVHRL